MSTEPESGTPGGTNGAAEDGTPGTGRAGPAGPAGEEGAVTAPATVPAPPETTGARGATGTHTAGGTGTSAAVPRAGSGTAAALAAVRAVLARGGAPDTLAEPLVGAFGERAAELLHEDPWHVLTLPGVQVEQADSFARALLGPECGPGDPRRARALVVRVLERAAVEGHTAVEAASLRAALAAFRVPDPDEALREAVTEGEVLVFQEEDPPSDGRPVSHRAGTGGEGREDGKETPVRLLLGLDRYALAEESLADGLVRLLSTLDPAEPAADWERAAGRAPSPSAGELLRTVAGSGLTVHTGGEAARAEPAALVAEARALGLRAWAAAMSGDSRGRLRGLLADLKAGEDAVVTLTGLLAGHEGPGRDEAGSLALDLLVVCDASQLDVETAATVVESLADGARLVLSGDPGVLWSAGAGRVFADLIAARVCPLTASRTPDPGPVGELVSGVGIGELTTVEAPGRDVVIVPVKDPEEAVHRTVQLVADSIPRAIGVPPEQTLVITPGHGGAAGTRALNSALKARLNPGPGRFGGFDPGDRVVLVPAPGRALPGSVESADAEGLHVDCSGERVTVPRDRLAQVRHGWAVTAHQAVGLRRAAVVVVMPGDAVRALTRQWVYTAFGRAERHLSVVQGVDQALPRAVAGVPARPRTTRLRSILLEQRAHASDD